MLNLNVQNEGGGGVPADMRFVKSFTTPDFQANNFTPLISRISTALVIITQKHEWKWRNLHCWPKFYTAAGSDGSDKSHLWWPKNAKLRSTFWYFMFYYLKSCEEIMSFCKMRRPSVCDLRLVACDFCFLVDNIKALWQEMPLAQQTNFALLPSNFLLHSIGDKFSYQ